MRYTAIKLAWLLAMVWYLLSISAHIYFWRSWGWVIFETACFLYSAKQYGKGRWRHYSVVLVLDDEEATRAWFFTNKGARRAKEQAAEAIRTQPQNYRLIRVVDNTKESK